MLAVLLLSLVLKQVLRLEKCSPTQCKDKARLLVQELLINSRLCVWFKYFMLGSQLTRTTPLMLYSFAAVSATLNLVRASLGREEYSYDCPAHGHAAPLHLH